MKLSVDEAIWGAPGLFAPLGDVSTFSGRAIISAQLADTDALIVRSVTRVDERLLKGTRVRFVGTASSGSDHVDAEYLAARGIAFADAAGCNSRTVAEYVLAAMLWSAEHGAFVLSGKTLGIVGVGRIGSIVADWGRGLGMCVLLCDPPLERQGVGGPYVGLDEIAAEADIVSFHVPLVRQGPDATIEMVTGDWLSKVKKKPVLINTSRGEVVCEKALLGAAKSGRLGSLVIDVWNGEPAINRRLVEAAAIATPHIAGYSQEARKRAGLMIRDRLAKFLSVRLPLDDQADSTLDGVVAGRRETIGGTHSEDVQNSAATRIVLKATGILHADRSLRERILGDDDAGGFDQLRSACAGRREFSAYPVDGEALAHPSKDLIRQWGFGLA